MNKLLSFSLFIVILLAAVIASAASANAQNVRMAPATGVGASARPVVGGHWRWNRRMRQYVWVNQRSVRVRIHRLRYL